MGIEGLEHSVSQRDEAEQAVAGDVREVVFVSVSELDCQRQLDRQALVSARVSNRVDGSDSTWPGTGGPLAQNRLPQDAVTSHLFSVLYCSEAPAEVGAGPHLGPRLAGPGELQQLDMTHKAATRLDGGGRRSAAPQTRTASPTGHQNDREKQGATWAEGC